MRPTRLGCLSGTGIVTLLLTLLIITGVGLARGGVLFSSGDLNSARTGSLLGGVASHADTGGRCAACHTAFWERETMSDRCLACHSNLLQRTGSFHVVMLAQSKNLLCQDCHTEHLGPDSSLTVIKMERFPHNDMGGFSLRGHQHIVQGDPFQCADCHGPAIAMFRPLRCLECHRELAEAQIEAHAADFGRDCLACHDGLDTYGAGFEHNQTSFPLLGTHAAVSCTECHAGASAIADLQATHPECAYCHNYQDPHLGEFGRECSACHNPQAWTEIAFDHGQSDFPLLGQHAQVECLECHQLTSLEDTSSDCFACHAEDDPHDQQYGQDCAVCHSPAGWENASFDHALAAFPLTGAHTSVDCSGCHINKIYRGTPQACQACHAQADPHAGQFPQDCAACHTTERWSQVNFDHSMAAFRLTGAHSGVACARCHPNGQYKGISQACAACHQDPNFHRGVFGLDCAGCHTTSAWVPAAFNQGHRFPLNHGGRRASSCSTCHPRTVSNYSCYGCHEHNRGEIENKHREESIQNFNNCVRCHPTGREEGDGGDD